MFVSNSVFSEPSPDSPLWRYVDFTKLVSLLETKKLYLNRSDMFEDPFEGTLPTINLNQISMQEGKSKAEVAKDYERYKRYAAISCWHANEFESAAMWKLYLQSSEGIALKSTFGRVKDSVTDSRDFYGGRVTYIDYEHDRYDVGNLLNMFVHKRKSFDHEKEVRFVYFQSPVNASNENDPQVDINTDSIGNGVPLDVDLSKMIEEIFVSPTASPWFTGLVGSVLARYGYSFPVRQSKLYERPVY